MDPVSIISLAESSLSLALQCAGTVKTLNDLAGKYRNAKLAISSMIQNLDAIQLAWEKIASWVAECQLNANGEDTTFLLRLEKLLESGNLVVGAFEDDLLSFKNKQRLSVLTRAKFIFNETLLQGHQNRLQ